MPSMAILPPWHMLSIMSRKAAGLPDISRPTSKPSFMPSCFCTSRKRAPVFDVQRHGGAHLPRQVQPVIVHVGDHHEPRAGVLGHGRRHDADRARRR